MDYVGEVPQQAETIILLPFQPAFSKQQMVLSILRLQEILFGDGSPKRLIVKTGLKIQITGKRKRVHNRDTLNAEIAELLKTKSSEEWVESMNAAGVPCGQIYTIDKTFADPQVQHPMQKTVHSNAIGDIDLVNQAIRMSRTPMIRQAPPGW